MGSDMEPLGSEIREAASYVQRDEEFGWPVRLVEQHRWLATRSEAQLRHLLVATAVNLAARRETSSPRSVLETAIEGVRFRDWVAVREKVLRISEGIEAEPEDAGEREPHGDV